MVRTLVCSLCDGELITDVLRILLFGLPCGNDNCSGSRFQGGIGSEWALQHSLCVDETLWVFVCFWWIRIVGAFLWARASKETFPFFSAINCTQFQKLHFSGKTTSWIFLPDLYSFLSVAWLIKHGFRMAVMGNGGSFAVPGRSGSRRTTGRRAPLRWRTLERCRFGRGRGTGALRKTRRVVNGV